MMKLWMSGSEVAVPTTSAFSSHLELALGLGRCVGFPGGDKALSFDAQPDRSRVWMPPCPRAWPFETVCR